MDGIRITNDTIGAEKIAKMVIGLAVERFSQRSPERAAEFFSDATENKLSTVIYIGQDGRPLFVKIKVQPTELYGDLLSALSDLDPEKERFRAELSRVLPCYFVCETQ